MKVVKFGGGSLASGAQLEKVFQIVTSDPERRAVVVSAPGKRHPEDTKVTDLLIECAQQYLLSKEATGLVEAIVGRYADIALELGLADDVINRIRADLLQACSKVIKQIRNGLLMRSKLAAKITMPNW